MGFVVLLHPKAAKEPDKLGQQTGPRIKERLRYLKNNPETVGKNLKPSHFWTLRIGDYRVIYEIDKAEKRVTVLFVGHRKRVHDDFSNLL